MQPRTLAQLLAAGRLGIGAAMIMAPGAVLRGWLGDDIDRPPLQVVARSLGARDAALGFGALMAMRRGQPARGWLEAGVASDAVDFAGTLLAFGNLRRRGAILTLATASAAMALGAYAAPRLDGAVDG